MEVREIPDDEVRATYPVMRQLRPQYISEEEYAATVGRMREAGYRLVAVFDGEGQVLGVAGFRIGESLWAGRVLYVDDLVTNEDARSTGAGAKMLRWLEDEGARSGCTQLYLDSGVQRGRAHRFYFREGMTISSFHFTKEL